MYVSSKLQIFKSCANISTYLSNIHSPMTQKEIRWETDFTWASWFVKLTHSEHLMFPLPVKKLKNKNALWADCFLNPRKFCLGLSELLPPFHPPTGFFSSVPTSSHLTSILPCLSLSSTVLPMWLDCWNWNWNSPACPGPFQASSYSSLLQWASWWVWLTNISAGLAIKLYFN